MFTELNFSLRLYVEMYNQQNLYSLVSFSIRKDPDALCSAHLQSVTLLLFKVLQSRICFLGICSTVHFERRDPRLVEAK